MTSTDIINLLAIKHAKDVFVPECKNGSTWFTKNGLRFDAWVMRRSWVHPLTIGYEIKVNRHDFTSDNKWPGYLDYCNEFYFVSPPDLIQPNEISNEAGLYWTSRNGKTLYLKKKAPYRNIEINPDIYLYVLMCRTKIISGNTFNSQDKIVYWRSWLKQKQENRDFGNVVSMTIRKTLQDRVLDVEVQNERLSLEIASLMDIKQFCVSLGITNYSTWVVKNKVKEAMEGMPQGFMDNLNSCIEEMIRLKNRLNKEREQYNGPMDG